MEVVVGFVIAATVGLTGIGGGSFTTPALVLLAGVSGGEAVGTALIFAAAVRLLAAPFYLLRRNIHLKYVALLAMGAIPGLLIGTWLLHFTYVESWRSIVLAVIGIFLTVSFAITFLPKLHNPNFIRRRHRWLSVLALPIGIETGFSSAGAGALGTVLLLNFSELSAAQVVGTDLLFGIILALVGGLFHLLWGSMNFLVLERLLLGGIPGVLFGCAFANKISSTKLRRLIALIAITLGLQLFYIGARGWVLEHRTSSLVLHHNKSGFVGERR